MRCTSAGCCLYVNSLAVHPARFFNGWLNNSDFDVVFMTETWATDVLKLPKAGFFAGSLSGMLFLWQAPPRRHGKGTLAQQKGFLQPICGF